jgi:hypothetical protein
MDGVILFMCVVGLFVCIFMLLNRTSTLMEKLDDVQKKLQATSKDVTDIHTELSRLKSGAKRKEETKPSIKPDDIPSVVSSASEVNIEKEIPIIPQIVISEVQEVPIEKPHEIVPEKQVISFEEKQDRPLFVPISETIKQGTIKKEAKPKQPGFFERNPDLEKFIGENLINKIGIAILVIGIGFFVKFAIDQEWINEIGRVMIGIVCGGILVAFAHYIRNTFRPFSSVLVGGGIAIFYLTIGIAFHEYELMSQTLAFIIMVIITLFCVVLSILYDRKELAIIAIIGGFASPFMVSTGSGNYQVLFTYVAVLNIGMLILSYFKRWNAINVITFVFTVVLFSGWMINTFNFEEEPLPYLGAMLFATFFYILFFAMNIVNNVKENKTFVLFELSMLLSNTFLYYSAGMFILKDLNSGLYQGLFTILIAVFNLGFAYVLFKNQKTDKNLVYLLIGLVLTFVTLSAPIQLEGNYITLFWSAEAVLLLWLSQKSGIQLMKIGSVIINGLMLISLVMDWNNAYSEFDGILPLFINKAFVATIMVLGSVSATMYVLKKETENELFLGITIQQYAVALEFVFILASYFGGLLEIYYQVESRVGLQSQIEITPIYTCSYNLVYIFLLTAYIRFRNLKTLEYVPILLTLFIAFIYLIYYNPIAIDIRDAYLSDKVSGFHYYYHYLNVILIVSAFAYCFILIKELFLKTAIQFKGYLWIMCFVGLYIASTELLNGFVAASFDSNPDVYEISRQTYKVGYPILWGLCSLLLMILGMKFKLKTLRIISLTIFGVALLKMFVFDIQEMSEGGKIAAFISLGVLLLIISFMYQKLKKLLTDE